MTVWTIYKLALILSEAIGVNISGTPEPFVLKAPFHHWSQSKLIQETHHQLAQTGVCPIYISWLRIGRFSCSHAITSSDSGGSPPLVLTLRKRSAEYVWPSTMSLVDTFDLSGGSVDLRFSIQLWIIQPSRNNLFISPSFHCTRHFENSSWCSLALDLGLGYWRPTARSTNTAFSALCWQLAPLFQSLICDVTWSIKSLPVLSYGTRKTFFCPSHNLIISIHYDLRLQNNLATISALSPLSWMKQSGGQLSLLSSIVWFSCSAVCNMN